MSKQTTNSNMAKKKALVIAIIAVVTAIVIAATLIIVLWEEAEKTFASNTTVDTTSSSDTISNGTFEYVEEDSSSYPQTAQDWNKYTYNTPTSTTHSYKSINSNINSVMGVVDTSDWDTVSAGLASYGITDLDNPDVAEDAEDDYVYMISNGTDAYSASIYSSSFSISASSSVKITVTLKTVDVTTGGAFIMVKQSSSSALEQSTSGTQYWYAHIGVEDEAIVTDGEWSTYELYIFNRTTSSKTVYCNVGLGNVYTNEQADGTLFIDSITYDTVTANEYRELNDDTSNASYIIESDKEDAVTTNMTLESSENTTVTDMTSAAYLENSDLSSDTSPFVDDNLTIYSFSNNGTVADPVTTTYSSLTVDGPVTNTCYLVTLWIRVISDDGSVLPTANIYLYEAGTDTVLGSFTNVQTSSSLTTDSNNGWAQYSFYIKPANDSTDVEIVISLGNIGGYVNSDAIPEGTILVTQPTVEEITSSQYSSATSGTYVSLVSLTSSVSTTTVTNGSFSTIGTNSMPSDDNLYFVNNWTGTYAGGLEILATGEDNITVDTSVGGVTSGVLLDSNIAPTYDDSATGVLQITNNTATSFGYLSSDISLSANTVYVLSVLVRNDDGTPNVYLVNKSEGTLVTVAGTTASSTNSSDFNLPDTDDEWTRYYFVYVTGDTAQTVNLALWNGDIEATESTGTTTGTVYFDQAMITTLGTYTRDNDTNDLYITDDDGEYTLDDDGNYILDTDLVAEITFTVTTGYGDEDITLTELLAQWEDNTDLTITDMSTTDVSDPEIEEEEEEEEEETTESSVDVSMLVTIISSSLLVGALLVVIVIKFAFNKKPSSSN